MVDVLGATGAIALLWVILAFVQELTKSVGHVARILMKVVASLVSASLFVVLFGLVKVTTIAMSAGIMLGGIPIGIFLIPLLVTLVVSGLAILVYILAGS
jgi:hypothetical protein